jgi:hypothetical protein
LGAHNNHCIPTKLDEWGLRIAKDVKRNLPSDYYVEFHVFRELVIADDGVIELDIPEWIRELVGLQT